MEDQILGSHIVITLIPPEGTIYMDPSFVTIHEGYVHQKGTSESDPILEHLEEGDIVGFDPKDTYQTDKKDTLVLHTNNIIYKKHD